MSVYMPCDNYLETRVNHNYREIINVMESTMHENNCYSYILTGDFNTSLARDDEYYKHLR